MSKETLHLESEAIRQRIVQLIAFCQDRNAGFDCSDCQCGEGEKLNCTKQVESEVGQIFFDIYEHFHNEENLMRLSEVECLDQTHFEGHRAEHRKIISDLQQLADVMEVKSSGDIVSLMHDKILPAL